MKILQSAYTASPLKPGELVKVISDAYHALASTDGGVTVRFMFEKDGITERVDAPLESLMNTVDLHSAAFKLVADVGRHTIDVRFAGQNDRVFVEASGDGDVEFAQVLVASLRLERIDEEAERRQWEADSKAASERFQRKLDEVSRATKDLARARRQLTAFISFKFGDSEVDRHVERLKRFLTLLDVRCVTGEQYEPRRIEDKVHARLRKDVDFLIVLLTGQGVSEWLRDEMADARARSLRVVVLKHREAQFEPGIFGSLEYIQFYTCIDQVFLSLLEGIQYIKAEPDREGADE